MRERSLTSRSLVSVNLRVDVSSLFRRRSAFISHQQTATADVASGRRRFLLVLVAAAATVCTRGRGCRGFDREQSSLMTAALISAARLAFRLYLRSSRRAPSYLRERRPLRSRRPSRRSVDDGPSKARVAHSRSF